ncbi:MAG: penicillin-binding protein 2 [Alphaproteobacteria bacterium]
MYRDHSRHKTFTRRALVLGGAKLVLLSALVGRMYYLQVVESRRYRMLAEDNRINLRLLVPPRGRILDRTGVLMADNEKNYRVVIVSEQTPNLIKTLDKLGTIIPTNDYDRRKVLREVKRKRRFVPITVRENLNWREVARVEVNAPNLPGVMIDVGRRRNYPFGEAAAHIMGYVAAVSERELTGEPLLELPDFRIGKNGVEKIQDLKLRGKAGSSQVEVNALGRVIRELKHNPGEPGSDLTLTIDMGLQKFTHERLGEESAAAVVVDVQSGAVLALASTPSFDPNLFTNGIGTEDWRELVNHPRAPLTNKPIAGQYSPGSTFKMMVALAALEAGILGTDHKVFCPGFVKLGRSRFHCWKKHGHGHMDMFKAIQQSCDVYFYDVARRTGVDRISAMARRFGLGSKLGIDIPGERSGLMPTRGWKRAVTGVPWQLGETLVAGIGQGFVLSTPLQLAVMTARLANGGKAVTPFLVKPERGAGGGKSKDAAKGKDQAKAEAATGTGAVGEGENIAAEVAGTPEFPDIGVSKASLKFILSAMNAVTNSRRGTAYRSRIKKRELAMAGKTGTSQVRRITMSERQRGLRKNDQRPWRERDHALFVGFAPVDAPRFAVAVVVEHGGGGSKAAAPVARDILREVQRRVPLGSVATIGGTKVAAASARKRARTKGGRGGQGEGAQ